MELFKASRQWSERPDDERFASLEEMLAATRAYRDRARETTIDLSLVRVEAVNEEVQLVGRQGVPARTSHYAFGQLAAKAGAPANYLRSLPATLASQNLNHGLAKAAAEAQSAAKLMFHENGSLLLRSLTTEKYERVWNAEIVERLIGLQAAGWQVPPARPAREGQAGTRRATAEDLLRGASFGLSIKEGDLIAPAGLYASDHDMFAFMVFNDNRIDDGTAEGLGRGVFFENSEVGDRAIRRTTFLYRHVCGNHIVWDARNVKTLSFKHVGEVRSRFGRIAAELKEYANESVSDIEAKILSAKRKEIAATKEQVLDALFKFSIPGLTRKAIEASYDIAEAHEKTDGSPRSVWGMTQGITRYSQTSRFADTRSALDRAAGKVMQIAF